MKLVIGLGNEGHEYAQTRHNVGFQVVSALADGHAHQRWVRDEACAWVDITLRDQAVRCLQPRTMMNRSGEVFRAPSMRGAGPQEILIVCDDVNLPVGRLRLRAGGRDGGHHGLASCLEALGTPEVPRLRLGVGRDALPADLTDFVLSPFEASERPQIREAIGRAVDACEVWAAEGIHAAMNRVNASTG